MPKKLKLVPRKEAEVLEKIVDWCSDSHPKVEIQKCEYEKLIEKTAEKKIIDATIIGRYARRSRSGAKGCLISELEFEEHKGDYSILEGKLTQITIPLRKLLYWRNDIPQYWIKVDNDGTPFMINYSHIYDNRKELDQMRRKGVWQNHDQITRIKAAVRDSKEDEWPSYVLIGWDDILKELGRIIKMAGF